MKKSTWMMRNFDCEAMSHDLFSTKFARDGHADPLASTDYKEPPIVVYGFDSYNLCLTGEIGRTLATPSGGLNEHIPVVILNDQGGSVMDTSEDITSTLRAQDHGRPPVVCFEPGIARREGSDSRFIMDRSVTLRAQMCDNQPAVCYAIEGNVVDRASAKNGKGWCENVSPTLNTQDRHAICFQLCGDRDDPSVSVSDTAYCIPANPMSDRGQAVCYEK